MGQDANHGNGAAAIGFEVAVWRSASTAAARAAFMPFIRPRMRVLVQVHPNMRA